MNKITAPDGTPLSKFCFGCMQFGGKADKDASRALYDACRARGINFFDTAYVYTDGVSESWLGEFIADERDKIVVASKADYKRGNTADSIAESLEESRSRLGIDCIDIYYLHRWDADTPLKQTFDALAKAKKAGHITRVGVSNFAAWQVMKAQSVAADFGLRIDMIQPMFNLVKRQAEVELFPMCRAENIAAAPYSPLGGGLLTGKYRAGGDGRITSDEMYAKRYGPEWMHNAAADLAYLANNMRVDPAMLAVAWVARHPAVTAPIISARHVSQLEPSLAALDFDMDDALYARLSSLSPTPPPATDRLEEA